MSARDDTLAQRAALDAQRSQFIEALKRLWLVSQRDHGGSRVAALFLLGLYNGERFPFDLTSLRGLDYSYQNDAFLVLRLDAGATEREVHSWLNAAYGLSDFGERFEHMAHRWRVKGRCKKEWLRPLGTWEAPQS